MYFIMETLKRFGTISEQARIVLAEVITKRSLPKGTLLLEQGKTCKYLNFMESGFARAYYYREGKEITSWFAFENDIVASMYSFTAQKPSYENIEIMENCVLHSIHFDQLQQLYKEYPEFNLIGRLLIEKYFVELEERIFSLQIQSAKERYKEILNNHPELLKRASLGHIASYLGISQETLSRIRANI
ncbi:MAG: Crp/Fnr family transcriptional regulator [Chlorobi bacterium]|nr:Crp/Fnr family transcriptional regulator [Chlorobiota bacterium]